jgi:hypothetical protein
MATFDYTSRDFISIRQDLITRASRTIPEWNSDDASDFSNMFVDLWAYMGDILHFYIDRAASETFLDTATQRESVLAIANLMDYKVGSTRAAKGTVTLKVNSVPSGSSTYLVPQYTQFVGYATDGSSYNFYLSNATTAASAGYTATGTVVQGTIVSNELIGSSSGFINQKFVLSKTGVDNDSITIDVYEGPLSNNNPTKVTYQYVDNLSSYGYLSKVFTTSLTSDGYTQIIFGNGFNGYIPTNNASIFASYRVTDGSAGNLPANSLKTISGTPSTYVSILSSSTFSGGADVESITSIKNNVRRLYRTQDRAVSLQDYKDLTLQIAGVSKSTAVYAGGSGSASCNGASVTLYPVPHQSTYPPSVTGTGASAEVVIEIPTPMAESIEAYFSTRSMAGVTAKVVDPTNLGTVDKYITCTPIYMAMTVNVLPTYVQSWVKENVTTAIKNLLSFENVYFGQIVTIGDVYRVALEVAGVDYVQLTNLNTTYGTTVVSNITIDETKLPCFTDELPTTAANPAITLTMVGGLTGSN